MRVRRLIAAIKYIENETAWSDKDLQPRYAPIYPKTKPIRAGWVWKSTRCTAGDQAYVLVAECNPGRDNWKTMLLLEAANGWSVVGRFEFHGSHPGIHFHSDCDRSGAEIGTKSIDNLNRIPNAKSFHRRSSAWTENSFWDAAKKFFRIQDRRGLLGL